jgi:polysaccharide pyruvyl transferase WcaK-like protein
MKKKITVGIVGANPFCANRGINALAYSTLYVLNQISKLKAIEMDIFFLEPQYRGEIKYIKLMNEKQTVNLMPLFCFTQLGSWLRFFKTPKSILKALFMCNIILDISGGDSFSDIYGQRRFIYVCYTKRIYKFLRKKVVLLPQTIGPFSRKDNEKKALAIMRKCDMIFTRDNASYKYLEQLNIQNKIELIDIAFFLPFERMYYNSDFIHVGLNVSGLLWYGGYTQQNQFGLKDDYCQLIKDILDYFLLQHDVVIHLVAHVMNSDWFEIENDYAVSKLLFKEYDNEKIKLAPFSFDPSEVKSYISGLDYFIGARMHACIAAFSAAVPVYPLAYSRKFNGLFVDSLDYPYIGDMNKQSNKEIFNALTLSYDKRSQLKEIIRDRLNLTVEAKKNLIVNELTDALLS